LSLDARSVKRLLGHLIRWRLAILLTVLGIVILVAAGFVSSGYWQGLMLHVGAILALAAILGVIDKRLERQILGLTETQQILRDALISSVGPRKMKREAILDAVVTAGNTIIGAGFRQEGGDHKESEVRLVYPGMPEVKWQIGWGDPDGLRQAVTVDGRPLRSSSRKQRGVVFSDKLLDAVDAQSIMAFHKEVDELMSRVVKRVQAQESRMLPGFQSVWRRDSSTPAK
jgi:hypothetical protein